MSTDRELLEAAARAVGHEVRWAYFTCEWLKCGQDKEGRWIDEIPWNPLIDSGQCADMEADLGISPIWWTSYVEAVLREWDGERICEPYADHANDRRAARRAASVRLAAKIGAAKGETS